MTRLRELALSLALTLPVGAYAQVAATMKAPARDTALGPDVPREFRAVWIATVSNIDWPSKPGLSAFEQQAELLLMLNRALELNLNAVILQVRPAADAIYPSPYEPWSEYLTGRQGRAPEPYYDPLEFAVKEAHKRGLELHAWFNPYRARQAGGTRENALTHISQTKPQLVKAYGERLLWMDPGEPEVRRQSVRVIEDVVRRYDIDGIHMDDYFYPYPLTGSDSATIPFPDSGSYARYLNSGGHLEREDWRRNNVDVFIEQTYAAVKRIKPWVKVGISPFGIWRPGNPAQIKGFDAYASLYSDAKAWLVNGWVDYFTPQLYWPIAQEAQSYPVLLRWWTEQNVKGRHIWPGNFTSRAGARGPWQSDEIIEQIRVTRLQPGAGGNVHFSMKALMGPLTRAALIPVMTRNDTVPPVPFQTDTVPLSVKLMKGPYAEKALVPASPWLSRSRPPRPVAYVVRDTATGGTVLRIAPGGIGVTRLWVVRMRDSTSGTWRTTILPASQDLYTVTARATDPPPSDVLVSAVDRYGTEGAPRRALRRRSAAAIR